jgi:signal transduction histidine kinase
LYIAALAARAKEAAWQPLVVSIQRAVGALEGQFEQLLDLSRLEAGALSADASHACRLRRSSPGWRASSASCRSQGLALRVSDTRLAVRSDPALLERIVRNLVANAIRYTERGGVLVGARRVGGSVAIDVVDTGIGIPEALQSRIFEEFYQVRDRHTSRAHAGLGLGLAIVRRLGTLLEHRVDVASRVGRGSRFRVIAQAAARCPASAVVRRHSR